ncbi:hypothetical protein [Enterobacter cloacae complex sp. 277I4]|uniref:hypothetical protein n=1 Tax=Enterobacter cloacae complex sp. 277I4 TaxID=3395873 RepID=UPI003CF52220
MMESLLNYLFLLSKRRTSSTYFWMPEKEKEITNITNNINVLTKDEITITNVNHKAIITRIFSSDGTIILSKNGSLISFSTMISYDNNIAGPLSGTGEKVAGYLSKNGVAIKVSQDGSIKIFIKEKSKPPYNSIIFKFLKVKFIVYFRVQLLKIKLESKWLSLREKIMKGKNFEYFLWTAVEQKVSILLAYLKR